MLDKDEDILEQEQECNAGVVMIDNEYYFKIQNRQYIFGKIRFVKDENSKNYGKPIYNDMLYPDTINGVFKLYFKHKQTDLTVGKKLTIKEFLDVINEIKAIIKNISEQLQMEG